MIKIYIKKEHPKMNKTQLIDSVAKDLGLKKREVEPVVEKLIEKIIDEVANGEKVQITGFGSFERKERGERNIKNPRTGEDMVVPPSKSPSFSAGSMFKEKVNK